MRLQTVLPKALMLIIITLQNEAFVNGHLAIGLDTGYPESPQDPFDETELESVCSLAKLVTLVKIPHGKNEDDKKVSGVTIKGTVPSDIDRFTVDLMGTSDKIGFHISLRFPLDTIVFNSYEKEKEILLEHNFNIKETIGGWGKEEVYEGLPIEPGNEFEIVILFSSITDKESFEIKINSKSYWFKIRTPIENLIFLRINGDVKINSVTWDHLTDQ